MKRNILLLIAMTIFVISGSGQCPSGWIDEQSDITEFANANPPCKILTEDMIIVGPGPEGNEITDLSGLATLEQVNSLSIYTTTYLPDFEGLDNLKIINGSLYMEGNPQANLTGFSSLDSVRYGVSIQNSGLTSRNGIGALTKVGSTGTDVFLIQGNTVLTTLNGLNNNLSVKGGFNIVNNSLLSYCHVMPVCESLLTSTISGDAPGTDCEDWSAVETACLALLPVELTTFTARPASSSVDLYWSTASESEPYLFDIEHSTGKDFQTTGIVAGHGPTTERQGYRFVHDQPARGVNYYRLKMVPASGGYEYSNVIAVEMSGNEPRVLPNPAIDYLKCMLDDGEEGYVTIYDATGKMCVKKNLDARSKKLTLQRFSPGFIWW